MDSCIVFKECEKERLATFKGHWKVSTHQLAECGFYFIKLPDIVKCASCNLELNNCHPYNNPMKQHKRWRPYCPLLRGYIMLVI